MMSDKQKLHLLQKNFLNTEADSIIQRVAAIRAKAKDSTHYPSYTKKLEFGEGIP